LLHKFHPDGQRGLRAGFAFAKRDLLVVETHPHAGGDLRREADKPCVGEILSCAGFSSGRPSWL
jgi:hypothetical protein